MNSIDVEREALRLIAEGATELAGFGAATISVVRGEIFETIAVAGERAAAQELMELRTPVALLLAELADAEPWGRFQFLPAERASGRMDGYQWVPELDPPETQVDAWDPMDLLCAMLYDDAGDLRGILSVDMPRNGRRPDAEQRRVLDVYARQAEHAVVAVLEREQFRLGLVQEKQVSGYRRQLFETLAHQLQNPLAVIKANLEIAADDPALPSTVQGFLASADRGATRISNMAADLLAMARVDNPDNEPPSETIDLALIVREVVDQAKAGAVAAEVSITVLVPDRPVWVRGDPRELDDLVSNLVGNAIKYTDRDGSVTVQLDQTSEPVDSSPWAHLTVSDDGVGVAPEDEEGLFDAFYRSQRREIRSREGTGLGLAIVQRIVQRHGGRIEVESELGIGTTFRVELRAPRGGR